jgi:hypothetical protein
MTDKTVLAGATARAARELARAVLIDLTQRPGARTEEADVMSWVDCMKLRRRADQIRMLGWLNFAITLIFTGFHITEGVEVLLAALVWVTCVMALSYAAAWRIDRRAERVVGR